MILGGTSWGLTFDMSGGRKQAQPAGGLPLDGRVRHELHLAVVVVPDQPNFSALPTVRQRRKRRWRPALGERRRERHPRSRMRYRALDARAKTAKLPAPTKVRRAATEKNAGRGMPPGMAEFGQSARTSRHRHRALCERNTQRQLRTRVPRPASTSLDSDLTGPDVRERVPHNSDKQTPARRFGADTRGKASWPRSNVRHERRAKGREAAFGTSAPWRG